MPNEVSYVDESTYTKVLTALHGDGELSFAQTLAAITRMQTAGILFREPAESRVRGPRTKAEEAADAVQAGVIEAPTSGTVASEVFGGDVETARSPEDPQSVA